jgi:AbrB family looped-hinge helix DNA binding protein
VPERLLIRLSPYIRVIRVIRGSFFFQPVNGYSCSDILDVDALDNGLPRSTILLVRLCFSQAQTRRRGGDVTKIATTRLSTKGQVVIPESIREQLHLEAGTQFVVVAEGDVVVLKAISTPGMSEFDPIIAKARKQAAGAGLTQEDIENAVRSSRTRK